MPPWDGRSWQCPLRCHIHSAQLASSLIAEPVHLSRSQLCLKYVFSPMFFPAAEHSLPMVATCDCKTIFGITSLSSTHFIGAYEYNSPLLNISATSLQWYQVQTKSKYIYIYTSNILSKDWIEVWICKPAIPGDAGSCPHSWKRSNNSLGSCDCIMDIRCDTSNMR